MSGFLLAALPPHGESGVLPGAAALPLRPLRPRLHRVRPPVPALPPPLPSGQARLLQAHGRLWRLLARGDGVQQVSISPSVILHKGAACSWGRDAVFSPGHRGPKQKFVRPLQEPFSSYETED